MTYREKLEQRMARSGSRLCVGLDPRPELIPGDVGDFLRQVIDETADHAAAFKPNSAYFEAMGGAGWRLLESLREWIPGDIPLLLDGKRGDIGETQKYYARAAFDVIGADAVTLNPYMGEDTLGPFLDYADKGLYLLGVTSNPGSRDIQMLCGEDRFVFEQVQDMTRLSSQIGLVVGLTEVAREVLSRIGDVPLLVPGLGAQGGDLDLLAGEDRQAPILINVSRGILFAEPERSFAEKAAMWSEKINHAMVG